MPVTAEADWGLSGTEIIEDFSTYTTQAEANTNWTPVVDDADQRVDISGNTLVVKCLSDNSNDGCVFDFGTALSDIEWIIRGKITFSDLGTASSVAAGLYMGMFSLDETSSASVAQDSLAIYLSTPGSSEIENITVDGAALEGTGGEVWNLTITATTYWFEFKRTSDTSWEVSFYSDSGFTSLVETKRSTCTSTTAGLQYFGIKSRLSNDATATLKATVDDIQVYDGISTFYREPSTWNSNYKAVHHLQGNSTDSTGYGNDGTNTAVAWEQQNNSVGLATNGDTTKITLGSDTSLDNIWDGGGHIKFTVNPTTDGENNEGRIIEKRQSSGWMVVSTTESGAFIGLLFYINFSGTDGAFTLDTVIPLSELSQVEIIYNADNVANTPTIIVNGIRHTVGAGITATTTPTGTRSTDAADSVFIGNETGSTRAFDGFIDNVRISDVTRPSSEVITSYNAEKSDSDMTTIGDENTQ
jgi:hypothetical protein